MLHWLARRSPRAIVIAGWLAFVLGCYPGYLSVDSTLQLYTVRSGAYTDYAPVMTALWSAFEWVFAGPFPMLVLQSGLVLFGLYAIGARVVRPRVAAVVAVTLVLFPPIFAPLAVIWPDPLMAGALLGGLGALLQASPRWKATGLLLFVVACSCRPEVVFALVPLVLLVVTRGAWWRRAGLALAIVIGVSAAARLVDRVLVETDTRLWQEQLMVMDTVGTLRRAKLKNADALERAFTGLPVIVDPPTLKARITAAVDALTWWPLSNGDDRILDPIADDAESAALTADWRHAISAHHRAYYAHRKALAKGLLGLSNVWDPVFDSLGDWDLLAELHHRATSSDWEDNMRVIVRGFAATPLFRPWLYMLLAIAALVVARRSALPRALAVSALAWELAMFVFAPGTDYRFSHWLVVAACASVAWLVAARVTSPPDAAS
ncbi:MAG TPA: hypothetical protein VH143_27320 [Kofleriaceae bacterium]|nr:hypothetical protein [Kofleriaceae bacterium]